MAIFEQQLMAQLDPGKASSNVLIRRAYDAGMAALLDRIDLASGSERRAIDTALDKFDQPVADHVKITKRREALGKHNEKYNDRMKAIADAEADIARRIPPLPRGETAADELVRQELRKRFGELPDAQRTSLKDVPDEMLLAVASVPAILTSGMHPDAHARLVDSLQRKMYPDAMAQVDTDRAVLKAAKSALGAFRETARSSLGQEAFETHRARYVKGAA